MCVYISLRCACMHVCLWAFVYVFAHVYRAVYRWASQQELPFSIVSHVLPGLYHPKFHAYQAVLF